MPEARQCTARVGGPLHYRMPLMKRQSDICRRSNMTSRPLTPVDVDYSTRRVLAGSTRAARRAGIHVPADATASSKSAMMIPIR